MWAEGRSGTDRERVGFPRNEKRKLDDGNSAQMEKQMNAAKALFESFGFRAAAGTSQLFRQTGSQSVMGRHLSINGLSLIHI